MGEKIKTLYDAVNAISAFAHGDLKRKCDKAWAFIDHADAILARLDDDALAEQCVEDGDLTDYPRENTRMAIDAYRQKVRNG